MRPIARDAVGSMNLPMRFALVHRTRIHSSSHHHRQCDSSQLPWWRCSQGLWFLRVAESHAFAVERLGGVRLIGREGINKGEGVPIGRPLVELEVLATDGIAFPVLHSVAVVENLEKGPCLPFHAWLVTLRNSMPSTDCLGAVSYFKISMPWKPASAKALINPSGVGSADASLPEVGVFLQFERNGIITDDVGYDGATAFEHAEYVIKVLPPQAGLHNHSLNEPSNVARIPAGCVSA